MAIRKGDIITHVQLELGDERFKVLDADGSRIQIKDWFLNRATGRARWVRAVDYVIVNSVWKEKELWIILWKPPGREDIRNFTFENEHNANENRRIMLGLPGDYTILSQHKITLPYKEPR